MLRATALLLPLALLLAGPLVVPSDTGSVAVADDREVSTAQAPLAPKWYTSHEAAMAAAKKQKKPVLADFTGSDWCHWCIRLKKEVFDTAAFRTWAAKNVILLELDFPRRGAQSEALRRQNERLARRFGIEGFPTVVFIDAGGKELGRTGYVRGGAKAWIAAAEKAMKPAAATSWLTSWSEARALAKKTGRPILADFTGSDWCHWCIRLKKEVFDTAAFKAWAAKNVVLLELDFPRRTPQSDEQRRQNRALAEQFDIEGYPTVVFVDHGGRELGRTGYRRGGPEAWIAEATRQMRRE